MKVTMLLRRAGMLTLAAFAALTVTAGAVDESEETTPEVVAVQPFDPMHNGIPAAGDGSMTIQGQPANGVAFNEAAATYRDALAAGTRNVEKAALEAYDELSGLIKDGKLTDIAVEDSQNNTYSIRAYNVNLASLEIWGTASFSSDDISAISYLTFTAYTADHPFEASLLSRSILKGSTTFAIAPLDKADERAAALQEAVDLFQTDFVAAELETPQEKYIFIHDYLCRNLYYNSKAAETNSDDYMDAHTAYGALVGADENYVPIGNVVCEAYANAYTLLCQTVGLPCIMVVGSSSSAEAEQSDHAWNEIKIDGQWYAVDVTWDDITDGNYNNKYLFSTWNYDFFAKNSLFPEENSSASQNHYVFLNGGFAGSTWGLEAPEIDKSKKLDTAEEIADYFAIMQNNSDTTSAMTFEEIEHGAEFLAQSYCGGIPNEMYFILTNPTTVSTACTVPAGKSYYLTGASDTASLTGTGSFTVSSGSLLMLTDITSAAGTIVNDGGTLELKNAAISGAVTVEDGDVEGEVGEVWLSGGVCGITSLDLGSDGVIYVAGKLADGSSVQVTCTENRAAPIAYDASKWDIYTWTPADRAKITAANETTGITYDGSTDALYYGAVPTTTTDASMTVSFVYRTSLTPENLTGATAQVKANGETGIPTGMSIWEAAYDADGKLLALSALELSGDTITLTAVPESTAVVKLLAVSGTSAPLAEAAVLSSVSWTHS